MNISSISANTISNADNGIIGTMVLAKCLDSQEAAGQSIVKMMEQSVNPELGQNIDLRV